MLLRRPLLAHTASDQVRALIELGSSDQPSRVRRAHASHGLLLWLYAKVLSCRYPGLIGNFVYAMAWHCAV